MLDDGGAPVPVLQDDEVQLLVSAFDGRLNLHVLASVDATRRAHRRGRQLTGASCCLSELL